MAPSTCLSDPWPQGSQTAWETTDGVDMYLHRNTDQWGLCIYVIVHTIWPPSPVILWIELGGKTKWLPLKCGYHDVKRMASICEYVNVPNSHKLGPESGLIELGQTAATLCQTSTRSSYLKIDKLLVKFWVAGKTICVSSVSWITKHAHGQGLGLQSKKN